MKTDSDQLYSVKDAALHFGVDYNLFWGWANYKRYFPAPTVQLGKRMVYTSADIQAIAPMIKILLAKK